MSKIRKHLTFANATMTLALVFAMTGGAYAASKYVISSTKQISPKVLAALKGKAGASGAQGSVGPAGVQGPAGAVGVKGETGAAGQNGIQGEKGAQGEKGTAGTNGFNGTNGAKGVAGPAGPIGPTGEPWTAGGTLPVDSSESGQWSFELPQPTGSKSPIPASISFGIPLESALSGAHGHFINFEEGEGEAKFENKEDLSEVQEAFEKKECSGSVKGPKAGSGNLCVFANKSYDENETGLHTLKIGVADIRNAEAGAPGYGLTLGVGRSGASLTVSAGEYEYEGSEYNTAATDYLFGDGDWVVTG
ncbi:MAG: hypothetical protein WBQ21_05545 [Solirubrobacteraceae bacterium]